MPHSSVKQVLDRIGCDFFEPFPMLSHPHVQTIGAVYWPQKKDSENHHRHSLELDDGDHIILMENYSMSWKNGDRIVVLAHGLTGCYRSNYMTRLCQKFVDNGTLVVRPNQRGCGPGIGHAAGPAHSGRSEDFRAVLLWLKKKYPNSPVTQIGFSLGANISLKLAGEDGSTPSGNLDSLIAVSPPIDLAASSTQIAKKRNRIYDRYFSDRIIEIVEKTASSFTDFEPVAFPKGIRLWEIDDLYTAPRSGFKNASDYYEKCSSKNVMSSITIPTLVLASMDDPVVDTSIYSKIRKTKNMEFILTRSGGHVGFLGRPQKSQEVRWMDQVIEKWMDSTLN